MITPSDIENKEFTRGVRGYKEEEVDEFLDMIILDMEKLLKENRQLKKELEKAQSQVDRHVSTESSVYETLEAAKSLMNDIAASAEKRAEVMLKDAELEAAHITREARESISKLTEDSNKMRRSVERVRDKYKQLLEDELERIDAVSDDLLAEFEGEILPEEELPDADGNETGADAVKGAEADMGAISAAGSDVGDIDADDIESELKAVLEQETDKNSADDLAKTVVNLR